MKYTEVKELMPIQEWRGDYRAGLSSIQDKVNKMLQEGWEVINTFDVPDKYYGDTKVGYLLGKTPKED